MTFLETGVEYDWLRIMRIKFRSFYDRIFHCWEKEIRIFWKVLGENKQRNLIEVVQKWCHFAVVYWELLIVGWLFQPTLKIIRIFNFYAFLLDFLWSTNFYYNLLVVTLLHSFNARTNDFNEIWPTIPVRLKFFGR